MCFVCWLGVVGGSACVLCSIFVLFFWCGFGCWWACASMLASVRFRVIEIASRRMFHMASYVVSAAVLSGNTRERFFVVVLLLDNNMTM